MHSPSTLAELRQFAKIHNATKYPNVPTAALPATAFTDKTANGLTNAIIYDIQHVRGGAAYRINNGATYDRAKNIYRAGVTKRGVPDIIGVLDGRFIGIEVKIGTDRQSSHQREVEVEINAAGGVYFIAKTYEGYVASLDAHKS
jgi:hypothetical protein